MVLICRSRPSKPSHSPKPRLTRTGRDLDHGPWFGGRGSPLQKLSRVRPMWGWFGGTLVWMVVWDSIHTLYKSAMKCYEACMRPPSGSSTLCRIRGVDSGRDIYGI
uniref:Uncharacterized protein n=1 Tax=Solanum tuberosum TaxID=4113 RepID=M1DNP9_SOLTU